MPGKREDSILLATLTYDGFKMPPAGKPPDDVIADFETWIDMGAPDPRDEPLATIDERTVDVEAGRKHWSYRRLAPVSAPEVVNGTWPKNDIEAAKATMARRMFFPPRRPATLARGARGVSRRCHPRRLLGRTSDSQEGTGRDDNPGGFTIWTDGGGHVIRDLIG